MEGVRGRRHNVGEPTKYMNTEEVLSLIKQIEDLKEKEKFKKQKNVKIRAIREKLYTFMGNEEYMVVGNYVLAKQHHARRDTVAIYTKQTWQIREDYAKRNDLSWIK